MFLNAHATGEGAKWVLPFTAGGFIYVALVNIVPTLTVRSTVGQTLAEIVAMCLGVGSMALIALYE